MKDIDLSIHFYTDILGLKTVSRFPHGALLQGGGLLVGIHQEELDRKSNPCGTLLVFQTKSIARDFDELRSKGVSFLNDRIENDFFGQIADFKDPDGYTLEIWQSP